MHVQVRREKAQDIGLILAFYVIAMTAIGWIMRGFLDIPLFAARTGNNDSVDR